VKESVREYHDNVLGRLGEDTLNVSKLVSNVQFQGGVLDKCDVSAARDALHKTFMSQIGNSQDSIPFTKWFGKFITTPIRVKVISNQEHSAHYYDDIAMSTLLKLRLGTTEIRRQLGVKCSYTQINKNNISNGFLFIDGHCFDYDGSKEEEFVAELCSTPLHRQCMDTANILTVSETSGKHFRGLLGRLLDFGFLMAGTTQKG
jgi:hypothetical protein